MASACTPSEQLVRDWWEAIEATCRDCLQQGLPNAHIYLIDPGDDAGLGGALFRWWASGWGHKLVDGRTPAVVATATTAGRSVRLLQAYEIAMPPLDQFTDKGAVWPVVAANGCVSMARWDSDAGRN
jgi:hypothetical protein